MTVRIGIKNKSNSAEVKNGREFDRGMKRVGMEGIDEVVLEIKIA